MHNRQNVLNKWLEEVLGLTDFSLELLAPDASFRQYYRLRYLNITRIVMDAPPDNESLQSFIEIASILQSAGVRAPHIFASNKTLGFALLDDFGDNLLRDELSPDTVDKWYKLSIDTLVAMQQGTVPSTYSLPYFDSSFMLYELDLFNQWFLNGYLKIDLTIEEAKLIQQTFSWLSAELFKQPKVFIHRDYHCRNIMIINNEPNPQLGIIDFQDAMLGPFTYDLVSLLKDCYVQWPREAVLRWLSYFYEQSTLAKQWTLPLFIRAFDLCGLQRHLKVLGIFSRLYLRDNKPGYLKDLPLTLHYVMACLESYGELWPFYQFMQQRIQLP
jgi:N-acetylmuramate 1-kinase